MDLSMMIRSWGSLPLYELHLESWMGVRGVHYATQARHSERISIQKMPLRLFSMKSFETDIGEFE